MRFCGQQIYRKGFLICLCHFLYFLDIFSVGLAQWKSMGLPHIVYIVIHQLYQEITRILVAFCNAPNDNEIIQKDVPSISTFIYCSKSRVRLCFFNQAVKIYYSNFQKIHCLFKSPKGFDKSHFFYRGCLIQGLFHLPNNIWFLYFFQNSKRHLELAWPKKKNKSLLIKKSSL